MIPAAPAGSVEEGVTLRNPTSPLHARELPTTLIKMLNLCNYIMLMYYTVTSRTGYISELHSLAGHCNYWTICTDLLWVTS